jgi:hypothetical protein
MHLQHHIRRQRHRRVIAVNGVQRLAIASDLLLRAVRGLRAIDHQVANARARGHYAFNPVRRLSALNERVFTEGLKDLRRLLFEQRLFAPVLPNQPDALEQAVIDELSSKTAVLEGIRHELDHIISI